MSKNWKLAPVAPKEFRDQFSELHSLVVQLLYNRGLRDTENVEKFLNPQYNHLYDPFIFKDMQKAVGRIWQGIEGGEKIFIYGDYDADAVTANAVLQQMFRYLGVVVQSYVPDRFTEGYGLNIEAFEKIKQLGGSLVVTVDCGTNSVDVAEWCKTNAIDLIITDHHEITAKTPDVYALINPKNPSDVYPDNQITGVGVAYKLAKALLSSKDRVIAIKGITESQYQPEWDKWLLDLVAIGTVADCHSLLGENRILVGFGLKVLAKTKWLGLRELMRLAGVSIINPSPDTYTLGFILAPRINAAGRLEHANIALQLLTTLNILEAQNLALKLEEINKRRQDLTARAVSEAKEQAELISDRKILLLYSSDWPKGIVGLVAGRLAEIYKRPVLILEKGEMESTGSARSGGGFDIVECLKACAPLLVKFGGHKQAAGLTLKTEFLEEFYSAMLQYAESHNEAFLTEPELELEAEINEADLILATVDELARFEPVGVGNLKPRFFLRNARMLKIKLVGNQAQHIQIQLGVGSRTVDSIGFNLARATQHLDSNATIDIACELIADSWNGSRKLKLRLISVKPSELTKYE